MYGYGNSMFLATHGILARTASGGGVDPNAQAFITAASITDPTQQSAINQLVVDLKGYSIWSKMKALYPFVGGTASQHKWNLKDPRDLNAAFRLVFSGGWTHSANGARPNGTNGYANTYLTPSTALTLNSSQLSLYSRTSLITNGQRDFGAYTNLNPPAIALGTNTGVFISDQYNYFTQRISASITAATGFYTGTRTSATSHKLFKNGSVIGTDTSTNSTALPVINLFLGAINSDPTDTAPFAYSNKQYAFASIGDGLTDAEAANFYTAVQAFQTTLSRNV
jgi:hypothetical protein